MNLLVVGRLLVVGFLGFYSVSLAAGELTLANIANTLGLIEHHQKQQDVGGISRSSRESKRVTPLNLQSRSHASQILNILTERLSVSHSPSYITQDLAEMAEYYAQFPSVVALLKELASQPWILEYDKNRWSTQIRGTALTVQSAVIKFDTRAAAQLKLRPQCDQNPKCIASPADALLHELLHIKAAFLDTKQFIASGGMNTLSYPMLHEMDVIHEEKRLYKTMEKVDGNKRPQRSTHSGKISKASCVTCIM